MSTPGTPPVAPVAAPSAPAAAPVPVETPSAGLPASNAPASTPAAAPAAPAAPVAPKNTDFPNTPDGQIAFLAELKKFEKASPAPKPGEALGVVKPSDVAAAAELGKQPDAKVVAEQTGQSAEPAPAEPKAGEAAAPATPQQLADLMKNNPKFGEFMDANPDVKGPVFQMARKLAEVQPIADMFPTVGDAEFAQANSTDLVALKTASMRAVHQPDTLPELLSGFDGMFQVVDAQGKPILENGAPKYDADRQVFIDGLLQRELGGIGKKYGDEATSLRTKLQGHYPNEAARQMDQKRLENLEYVDLALKVLDQAKSGDLFKVAAPQIPADASAEFKTWAEQQKADIEAENKRLADAKQGNSAEQQKAQRTEFTSAVRGDMGNTVGMMIGQQLRQQVDSGVYIPEFYLQQKYINPQTQQETTTSDIAARLFMQFEQEIMKPGSRTLMDVTAHELLPANDQTKAIRKDWYAKRAADIVPRLVKAEVDRIQKLVKADQTKQEERNNARTAAINPEPASGGSGLPQGASDAQIRAKAEELAKEFPGWAEADESERQARTVTQIKRLRHK